MEEHDCISNYFFNICWQIIPQFTTFKFNSPFTDFRLDSISMKIIFVVCRVDEFVYFHQHI